MWYIIPKVNGLKQGHNRFSWQFSKQYFKDFQQGNKTWIEIIHFAISTFFLNVQLFLGWVKSLYIILI